MSEKETKDNAPTSEGSARRQRKKFFTKADQQFLKKIGLNISSKLFSQNKSVERLAHELSVSRSALREIIAGRSNPRILTLHAVAMGLGYSSLVEFLNGIDG